jgi:hypothetical protein
MFCQGRGEILLYLFKSFGGLKNKIKKGGGKEVELSGIVGGFDIVIETY